MTEENSNGTTEDQEPVVVHTMTIEVMSNDHVRVRNIPKDYDDAMTIILRAVRAVSTIFLKQSMEGNLRSVSKIVIPELDLAGVRIPLSTKN